MRLGARRVAPAGGAGLHLLGRRALWRGAFPGPARQDDVWVASHHVWSWLDVHRQWHQPLLLRQEPGDVRSESPVGLRAGFGVRTTSLLGGDIRQKLLPLSRSILKPSFRSAKGFLPSLDELEHRQRQNRNVCILFEELPGVALCIFLRCGWRLVAGCSVCCFSLLVRSIPGWVSCFRVA